MKTTPEALAVLKERVAPLKGVTLLVFCEDLANLIADLEEAVASLKEVKGTQPYRNSLYCQTESELASMRKQLEETQAKLAAAERHVQLSDIDLLKAYSRANDGKQLSYGERSLYLRYARIAISAQEGK